MPKAHDRTILVTAAAAIIGANVIIASLADGVLPDDQPESPVAAQAPAVIETQEAPAYQTAKDLLKKSMPAKWKRNKAIQAGVVDILELGCGAEAKSTAILGYNRSVKIEGETLVAAVEIWPAGSGALAIDRYSSRGSNCSSDTLEVWSEDTTVAGYPAVIAGVQSRGIGTRTLRWSIGDVTLSLTGDLDIDSKSAAKAWTREATKSLKSVCKDLNPTIRDATRSPWRNPRDYRGLFEKAEVSVIRPLIRVTEPPKRPRLQNLLTVERPTPPQGVPIWPLALPDETSKPNPPTRPEVPKFRKRVAYQVPDPIGPGCGWAFTVAPATEFTQLESDKQRTGKVARANDRLQVSANDWAAAESEWRQKQIRYLGRAADYKEYAAAVTVVSKKWDEIRRVWAEYNKQVNAWQASLAARDAWRLRRAQAEVVWPTNQCPPDTPRPVAPSPVPSGSPTPAPAPALTCLFDPPVELAQGEPGVLPAPARPPDPRPKKAR